jgi:hypothetical protein
MYPLIIACKFFANKYMARLHSCSRMRTQKQHFLKFENCIPKNGKLIVSNLKEILMLREQSPGAAVAC